MIEVGSLIIASPEITHNLVAQSVILICECSEIGHIGLIINKRLKSSSEEELKAIAKLADNQIITITGGPIHPDEAFMLHDNPKLEDKSITLLDNVYLGSLLPIDPEDHTHQMRLIFGYMAWGPGALSKEIEKGLFILAKPSHDLIFMQPIENQWHAILTSLSGKWSLLSRMPKNLELN